MSTTMEEEFKRWTAKRKAQMVLDILQGRTTVAEASRSYHLTPSEIEEWVEDGRKGMESALRTKPLDGLIIIDVRTRSAPLSVDARDGYSVTRQRVPMPVP
jgi:transposase-like protein